MAVDVAASADIASQTPDSLATQGPLRKNHKLAAGPQPALQSRLNQASQSPAPSPSASSQPPAVLPLPQPSAPSPAPHTKTHHHCTTPDGWRLHLVHTRAVTPPPPPAPPTTTSPPPLSSSSASSSPSPASVPSPPPRRYPVVLCPGLGSSGAYTFDLSPVVSLADYLASRGWDVWTVELRGNGQSDRPRLFVRSRWWTIDDYVTKDLPAVLSYVRQISGADRAHVIGHSMGGMILTRLLALGGEPAAAVASATVVGSGCFLQGSWWQALEHTLWLARFLWLVPAGATLRAYSPLALGRAGLAAVDQLYFWPPNTDPALARAVLARNFSAISSGVILQFSSAFGPRGLRTADGREAFADPARLAAVRAPVMFVCGDRDRMCPPKGAAATCALFTGSPCARYVELGPRSATRPTRHHYGHFDILMGRHAETEVFPLLAAWLEQHDAPAGDSANGGGVGGSTSVAAPQAMPSNGGAVWVQEGREYRPVAHEPVLPSPMPAGEAAAEPRRQGGAATAAAVAVQAPLPPPLQSTERRPDAACGGGGADGSAAASPEYCSMDGSDSDGNNGDNAHGVHRNPTRAWEGYYPPAQAVMAQFGNVHWAAEPAVMLRSRL